MYIKLFLFISITFLTFLVQNKQAFCPVDMKYKKCKRKCSRTCPSLYKPEEKCPNPCHHYRCQCKKWYHYLTHNYKCVKRRHCPKKIITTTIAPTTPRCPKNEIYTRCKAACKRECSDRPGVFKPCLYKCAGAGCDCRYPNAINRFGQCVKIYSCRRYRLTFLQRYLSTYFKNNNTNTTNN